MDAWERISIWYLLWRMIRYVSRLHLADSILWMFIMGLPAVPDLIIRKFFGALIMMAINQSSCNLRWCG